MFDRTMQRQVKGVAFAMIAFVAALTAMGAGKTVPAKARQNVVPIAPISIPGLPELEFSNKLSQFPLPEVLQTEGYCVQKYYINCFRAAAPYVPDIIYEKSQLPYPERMKFLYSLENNKIRKGLQKYLEEKLKGKKVGSDSLVTHVLALYGEVLILGQPAVTLPTKAANFREAVDVCGMTQFGQWMDVQKAKNRELRDIIPPGYDAAAEAEAMEQKRHLYCFEKVYDPFDYKKQIGILPEKPIRSFCPMYTASDFSHLSHERKTELIEMIRDMPREIVDAPGFEVPDIYRIYAEIQADKTGYEYMRKLTSNKKMSKEYATVLQKLALEMLTYKRPLELLRAGRYSLKQVIYACRFEYAEEFYRNQKEGKKRKEIEKKEQDIYAWEANALVALGKRYHNQEWIKFGDDMLKAPPPVRIIAQEQGQASVLASQYQEDLDRLPAAQKNELMKLMALFPEKVVQAPHFDTARTYALYQEIQADQTGYRYVQQQRPGLSREQAQKVQQLSLEMVIYKRPLALLRAEDYSLEQVMKVCKFRNAEIFYGRQQKGERMTGEIYEIGFVLGNLQAKALMHLGKKYNHPDWVEFGQEMYDAYQKRIVVKDMKRPVKQKVIKIEKTVGKHDDTRVIQNQVARVADEPRVRNQSKEDGKSAKAAESSAQKKAR